MMSTKKGLLIGALSLSLGMVPLIASAGYISKAQMQMRTTDRHVYMPNAGYDRDFLHKHRADHKKRADKERRMGHKHLDKARHDLDHANHHIGAARHHQGEAKKDLGSAQNHINQARWHFRNANAHDRMANY